MLAQVAKQLDEEKAKANAELKEVSQQMRVLLCY